MFDDYINRVGAGEDTLTRGKHSFGINFLKWQDSKLGKYIEFKIRVTYLEGPQAGPRGLASPAVMDANTSFQEQ